MKKSILLINKGKSFMAGTIIKNLTENNYEVIAVQPTMVPTHWYI